MSRKVFCSFHYTPDCWRAGQVRNAGVIEGNAPVSDNDWETITRSGDAAIERWIASQMSGTSCAVVLIGTGTAGRKWINHEIVKAWNDGKGVVGVHVHNLQDQSKRQSTKGGNPFGGITMGQTPLSSIARVYDPPYWDSTSVYAHITSNLTAWVEEAIAIRGRY